MKIQRRPFMVEVKRGTTRSAFTVKDTMPEVMRKAEAVLFRHAQIQSAVSEVRQSRPVTGRILPSIIEDRPDPEILVPQSYDPRKRRGKRPKSKNKPKAIITSEERLELFPSGLSREE